MPFIAASITLQCCKLGTK